jgi:hypothetical protein
MMYKCEYMEMYLYVRLGVYTVFSQMQCGLAI